MEGGRKMMDSGVGWIGDLPKGWTISRIGDVAMLSAGIPAPEEALPLEDLKSGIPFIRVSDLSSWNGRLTSETRDAIPKSYMSNKKQKGTVIFPKSGESIRGGVRKVLSEDAVVVSHLACAKARNEISTDGYFYWILETVDFEDETNQTSLPSLNLSAIAGKPIPLAPPSEQQSIASYLDHHTSLIDRERNLIAKKIGLLKDKRKALIFECVTGKRTIVEAQAIAGDGGERLDDVVFAGEWAAVPTPTMDDAFAKSGRLVDSGVEWIGEVPEGWSLLMNKDVLQYTKQPVIGEGEDLDLLTMGKRGVRFRDKFSNKGKLPASFSTYQVVSPGDFVFCLFDVAETPRTIGVSSQVGMITGAYDVYKTKENTHINFLEYWFTSIDDRKAYQSLYSGMRNVITKSKFNSAVLAIPPTEDQKLLSNFLDISTNLVDREISLLERKSELLADKRKTLIFDAVTGKIDLRDTANT